MPKAAIEMPASFSSRRASLESTNPASRWRATTCGAVIRQWWRIGESQRSLFRKFLRPLTFHRNLFRFNWFLIPLHPLLFPVVSQCFGSIHTFVTFRRSFRPSYEVVQSRIADSSPGTLAERVGLDLPAICKLLTALCLRLKSCNDKDVRRLVDVLFLHDFIPSRYAF